MSCGLENCGLEFAPTDVTNLGNQRQHVDAFNRLVKKVFELIVGPMLRDDDGDIVRDPDGKPIRIVDGGLPGIVGPPGPPGAPGSVAQFGMIQTSTPTWVGPYWNVSVKLCTSAGVVSGDPFMVRIDVAQKYRPVLTTGDIITYTLAGAEADRWPVLVGTVPLQTQARWIRFRCDGFTVASPSTGVQAGTVVYYDGFTPTPAVTTVYNSQAVTGGPYLYQGNSGDWGTARYDPTNDKYWIDMMECP